VRFTSTTHPCGLVPSGSLAGVLRAGRVEALVLSRRWMLRPLLGWPAGPKAGSDGSYDVRGECEGRIQREVGSLAVSDQLGAYSFRSAEAADASRVAELVAAAYGH
jgi:hypothetical protein